MKISSHNKFYRIQLKLRPIKNRITISKKKKKSRSKFHRTNNHPSEV